MWNNKLNELLEDALISPGLHLSIVKEIEALIDQAYEEGCQESDDEQFKSGWDEGHAKGYDQGYEERDEYYEE